METEGATQESSTGVGETAVVPPVEASGRRTEQHPDEGAVLATSGSTPVKKVVPVSVITVDTSANALAGSLSKDDSLSLGEADHDGVDGPVGGAGTPSKNYNVNLNTGATTSSDPTSAAAPGGSGIASHQARTPKHANRTEESKSWDDKDVGGGGANQQHQQQQMYNQGAPFHSNSFPPPPPSRSSAFHPHDRHAHQQQYHHQQQPQQRMPMQVSPGSGRYYQYNNAGPPRYGHPPMPPFDQYHPGYRPPPPPYGHPGPMYSQPPYPEAGYEGGGPTWGRPPSYPNNGPPHPPPPPHDYQGGPHYQGPLPQHPPRPPPHHLQGPPHPHAGQQQHPPPIMQSNSSGNFSRAVSSSFDRSIKSHDNAKSKEEGMHHHHRSMVVDGPPGMESAVAPGVADGNIHGSGVDHQSSDDASWGQLNQVASVDEEEIRKRLAKDRQERRSQQHRHHQQQHRHHAHHHRAETPDGTDEVAVTRSASNSSSLTNSPTDGVLKTANSRHVPPHPDLEDDKPSRSGNNNVRIHSSLDSLSSVASEHALMMDRSKMHHPARGGSNSHLSPSQGSTTSLDLIKCASGTSALLMPRHESQLSYPTHGKRGHEDDEDRGDEDTKMDASELRKAPSTEDGFSHHLRRETIRPKKKNRTADDDSSSTRDGGLKKSSPLSIECSPPTSPSQDKRKGESKSKFLAHPPTSVDSYYDKPPQYTYSLESAPPLPRDPIAPTATRPESTSSTITPMNVDDGELAPPPQIHHQHESRPPPHHHHAHHSHHLSHDSRPPALGQIPSWEIHHQDSFGANSAVGATGGVHGGGSGHGAIMNSFSFTQDYPALTSAASADHGMGERGGVGHPPSHPHHATMESRNQSFEGGHYHGSFTRSDSMMSYEHQGAAGGPPPPPMYDRGGPPGGGYHGPFPPQAPSWGSASSFPPHGHYYPGAGGYSGHPMRNYSEDSGGRASPPPGMRDHRGFQQPPPEFRAPPSMVPKAGPSQSQQHILSSPYTATSKAGVYGWSKEEDMRLTDIMKKYKNPRDWDPIAKEHNCGRTAKECHERWIRYLKPGVRKGQWTDHEDAIVMEVVTTSTEQPFTRWSDLAQRLPGRVGKQIRDRWVNHLNPNINHLPFSREDDLLLWEGHKKLGKRWVEISTKYFESNRSENHIKNRWYSASFKKFISNEFGVEAYSGNKVKKEASSPKKKKEKCPSSGSVSPTKRLPPPEASQCEEV